MSHISRREFIGCIAGVWGLFPIMPGLCKADTVIHFSQKENFMELPVPKLDGSMSLERTIQRRRTIRAFNRHKAMSKEQYSQLMWAAQGITDIGGFKRASPSAGALYPIDIYGVIGHTGVQGMDAGVYHYLPKNHSIYLMHKGDVLKELAEAALSQMWMAEAPVNIIITAEYSRITRKYRDRGIRYALMEAGNISQNIFLQAEGVGLKAGIIGAFRDELVSNIIKTPTSHEPLLIMPVGFGA